MKTEITEVKSEAKEEPVMSDSELTLIDKDVQPVGQDYIEEIKNEEGERYFLVSCRVDHIHGLVVRVPGYRSRDPGFDSRCYQIF
jgi:hypothetical protein